MRTAGIICEYNPFHAGHRYQMEEIRRRLGPETRIVCLMSGNYVQRGEPAVYDKWTRAESAVRGGANLVLELPITVAVSAAGYFASGAVDCLAGLGLADVLCFGSEGADTGTLRETAGLLESPAFDPALRQALATGVSYARARETAVRALGGDGQCLTKPNSALGVDYIRELLKTGGMEPMALPRDPQIPSASELRTRLSAGTLPADAPVHTVKNGERAMLAVLRTLPDSAFRDMPFGSEGLWSLVMKACRRQEDLEHIIGAVKSRRYTWSRIRRGLMCLFLGLSAEDMARDIPYLRVLAFDDAGRALLHTAKKTCRYPLVSGAVPARPEAGAYFRLEARATDLYGLFAPPGVSEPTGREKSGIPRYVQNSKNTSCIP